MDVSWLCVQEPRARKRRRQARVCRRMWARWGCGGRVEKKRCARHDSLGYAARGRLEQELAGVERVRLLRRGGAVSFRC